jgi:hypothetical protein
MLRIMIAAVAALTAAGPSAAEQLSVESARQFVVGKLFAFNCFEGTRGAGRIYTDGSVAGTVQFGGSGPVRFVSLPAGTVRAQGESVCASVSGIPMQPCFNVDKTDPQSFRGSISGLRFAYCDLPAATTSNAWSAPPTDCALRWRFTPPPWRSSRRIDAGSNEIENSIPQRESAALIKSPTVPKFDVCDHASIPAAPADDFPRPHRPQRRTTQSSLTFR